MAPRFLTSIAPLYDQELNVWMHVPLLGTTAVLDNNDSFDTKGVFEGDGFTPDAISGAYTLLDINNVFYHGRETTIFSFVYDDGDVQPVGEFTLPDNSGTLVGMNLLYDGMLVYSTSQSVVGVISRDFDASTARQLALNDDESISNSIAVDETNRIYVVTSQRAYGIQWDGSTLSISWQANYNAGSQTSTPAGRLGVGSGSTPSLMGTRPDDDKFVVITDGATVMHIVLLWRADIPADWVPIVPGEPRIAAQVPVTFGNPTTDVSASEQSVLVRGYGAAVVDNYYGISLPASSRLAQLVILVSNLPFIAPRGVEKFEWDPVSRTFDSVWSSNISCPNGIPTMSAASGLMYCMGQRFAAWTLEALRWDDGSSAFSKFLGWRVAYNSAYAALEVGPNRELVTGALGGAIRFRAS